MPELIRIISDEIGFSHEEAVELVHAMRELRNGFQEQIDSVINVLMIRYPPHRGTGLERKAA